LPPVGEGFDGRAPLLLGYSARSVVLHSVHQRVALGLVVDLSRWFVQRACRSPTRQRVLRHMQIPLGNHLRCLRNRCATACPVCVRVQCAALVPTDRQTAPSQLRCGGAGERCHDNLARAALVTRLPDPRGPNTRYSLTSDTMPTSASNSSSKPPNFAYKARKTRN